MTPLITGDFRCPPFISGGCRGDPQAQGGEIFPLVKLVGEKYNGNISPQKIHLTK